MTNQTKTIITDLRPFIQQITSAPLPSVPGVNGRFYSQIHRIRIEAVSQICCSLLVRTQTRHGAQTADELRETLEPIRLDLLAIYPDCAALLDFDSWPNLRRH